MASDINSFMTTMFSLSFLRRRWTTREKKYRESRWKGGRWGWRRAGSLTSPISDKSGSSSRAPAFLFPSRSDSGGRFLPVPGPALGLSSPVYCSASAWVSWHVSRVKLKILCNACSFQAVLLGRVLRASLPIFVAPWFGQHGAPNTWRLESVFFNIFVVLLTWNWR